MKNFLKTLIICLFPFAITAQQPEFTQHVVTSSFTKGADVIAVDLDKDGDMDIIGVNSFTSAEIGWWQNNGFNEFTKVIIRDNLNKVRSVRAEDINDDQHIDLVVAIYGENRILYLENNGDKTFIEYTVDTNFVGAHTIDIKDVNDDGNLDVLCSGFDNNFHNGEIAWWENNGQPTIGWTKHLISSRFQQSPFIYGEDMDGDDDLDVIACGELNGEILWWENDGNQFFTEHMVDSLFDYAHTVIARDVDLDGDMDILGAACMSSQIAWYENNGFQEFIKHSLGYFAGALWLDATDLDNDGDRDLFGAPQGASKLAWWENPGNQQFTKHYINSTFTQSFCVVPAMMDNDTDTDLVAIGWQSNKISWFENRLEDPNLYNHPECVVYDYSKKRYFVSNAAGENIGSIVEVDSIQEISYFITGIENPLGMCIKENILYVSDAKNNLLGFDLDTKENVMELDIPMIGNLDGMACDNSGNLFVIDTYGRIYRVNLQEKTYNLFVSGDLGSWPQDCIFDEPNNRLIVAGWGANASIRGVNLEDSTITNIIDNTIGYFDGITKDQFNNVYVASHNGGKILRYDPEFSSPPEIISSGHQGPAGINYNTEDNILAVPNYNSSKVDFIDVSVSSINKIESQSIKANIFPNPFNKETIIQFDLPSPSKVTIEIYDLKGNLIKIVSHGKTWTAGTHKIIWDRNNENGIEISSGEYFCKVMGANFSITKKLILLK